MNTTDPACQLRVELHRQLRGQSLEDLQRALRLVLLQLEARQVARRMLAPGITRRQKLAERWQSRQAGGV